MILGVPLMHFQRTDFSSLPEMMMSDALAQTLPHSRGLPPAHGCQKPIDRQKCMDALAHRPDLQKELIGHFAAIVDLMQQATTLTSLVTAEHSPSFDGGGTAQSQSPHTEEDSRGNAPAYPYLKSIALEQLRPSSWKIRCWSDQRTARLAGLLKQHGQVGVITARPIDDGTFEIIDGHAVAEAAASLGWASVRVLVVKRGDDEAWRDALLLNTSQDGLTDYDRARLCKELRARKLADSQAALADMLGCSQPTVSNCEALLALPSPVQDILEKQPAKLSAKTAKALARILPNAQTRASLVVEAMSDIDGELTPERLKQWLHDKGQQAAPCPAQNEQPHPAAAGSPISGRLHRSVREFVIKLEDPNLDLDLALKVTLEALHCKLEQLCMVGQREGLSIWEESAHWRRVLHRIGCSDRIRDALPGNTRIFE